MNCLRIDITLNINSFGTLRAHEPAFLNFQSLNILFEAYHILQILCYFQHKIGIP